MNQSWNYQGFTIYEFEELPSTNQTAFELAGKIPDRSVITAKSQTAGKGRLARKWDSPLGNLYFSLALRPNVETARISELSFLAVSALTQAVQKATNDNNLLIQNKWPNDLLISGKKIAGILLESSISHQKVEFVVIGVGLNLVSNPSGANARYEASNLKLSGVKLSACKALELFLTEFENLYQNWLSFGFTKVRNLWLANAYGLGEQIKLSSGLEGIFTDLDEQGNLILELLNNSKIKISADEINSQTAS